MLKEITTRICATGFLEANETGEFTHGGPTEIPFTLTNDATEECELMVELYEGYAVKEYLPYALADRDFADKYGHMEVEEIVNNGKLLQELEAIQEKYKEEFEKYGVTHLRLQQ